MPSNTTQFARLCATDLSSSSSPSGSSNRRVVVKNALTRCDSLVIFCMILVVVLSFGLTSPGGVDGRRLQRRHLQAHNNLNKTLVARHLNTGNEVAVNNAAAAEEQQARAAHWSLPNRPSLFSIIRFPNEECFDSSNQSGTCYTAFECKLLGGQPSSPCAAGFGSCCIVSRTCHVTTREKVIYFKNPSYPSADSDEKFCDLTVEISDVNVCQLRLDFLDFQLDPPTQGACRDDYMEISASGMPPNTVPRLCGLNRNQHRKYVFSLLNTMYTLLIQFNR